MFPNQLNQTLSEFLVNTQEEETLKHIFLLSSRYHQLLQTTFKKSNHT